MSHGKGKKSLNIRIYPWAVNELNESETVYSAPCSCNGLCFQRKWARTYGLAVFGAFARSTCRNTNSGLASNASSAEARKSTQIYCVGKWIRSNNGASSSGDNGELSWIHCVVNQMEQEETWKNWKKKHKQDDMSEREGERAGKMWIRANSEFRLLHIRTRTRTRIQRIAGNIETSKWIICDEQWERKGGHRQRTSLMRCSTSTQRKQNKNGYVWFDMVSVRWFCRSRSRISCLWH